MYCVMRASAPSLYNVYRRYDIGMICVGIFCIISHTAASRFNSLCIDVL